MVSSTVDVSQDQIETRKRKIAAVLDSLDASKFIPSSPAKQVSFAPWDRTALSARLLTYRQYPIHSLSSPINAYTLSRSGWEYADAPTIQCCHCHARIVILVDTKIPEARKALEVRYAEIIKTGHIKNCPWAKRACDVKLLRVPLADMQMSLQAMRDRVDTFTVLTAEQLADLEKILGSQLSGNINNATKIEQLALTGWSLQTAGSLLLLVCETCHRRLMLQLGEKAASKIELDHYDYCPWICAKIQGSEPGCTLLLQHYKKSSQASSMTIESQNNDNMPTTEENKEKLRNVRRQLGFL